MADITLTIPPAYEDRVIHAICKQGGYTVEDESGANAKLTLIEIIKKTVWRIETQEAEAAVAVTVEPDIVT